MTHAKGHMTHNAWEHELAAMEAYVDAHREAFSYRVVDRPPLRRPPPFDALGPLPDGLRTRADALLQATRAFEGEVADARASVATALGHVSLSRRACYVDARA